MNKPMIDSARSVRVAAHRLTEACQSKVEPIDMNLHHAFNGVKPIDRLDRAVLGVIEIYRSART